VIAYAVTMATTPVAVVVLVLPWPALPCLHLFPSHPCGTIASTVDMRTPKHQVSAIVGAQHLSTLTNDSRVVDTMRHLCRECWLNESWMPSLRLYQVSCVHA
jgi:hypothetical protein